MKLLNPLYRWLLLFTVALMVSCSSKDEVATTRLEVRLTDAPGDYQEVNVDIQEIRVKSDEDSSSSGWKSINLNKGVYNLIKLTNGLDVLLGDVQLPVGKISQVRLILGSNNSIKIGGQVHSLKTPSAQQSGLKIQVHSELKEGITYILLLDFDAARSIVATGSGMFILKPVIRSVVEAQTGAIKGLISPAISKPAIYVLSGMDTVSTTYADSVSGKFLLRGIAAGTYNLRFAPKTGYLPTTKDNVSVTLGNITDVGTVTISQ